MTTSILGTPRGVMGAGRRAAAVATLAALSLTGCADKGLTRSAGYFNPKIALQLTTIASAQTALTPKFIWVGAAYGADKDTALLAYKIAPYAAGTQQISLPVDLAPCLAYNASKGKDGCTIIVGASLLPDTSGFTRDTTKQNGGDPFRGAFDYTIVGPFEVGPGRTPTIPAIDLSATRFGVITWAGDEALRLGGIGTPTFFGGQGVTNAPLTGVFSGTNAPTLFSVTSGVQFPATPSNTPLQAYPQLAIFQNGAWQRVSATSAPPNTNFYDVTAFSAAEAYLAAPNGLYKYDGTAITRISAVPDSLISLGNVNNITAKLVIAGGANGLVWIGDTQTWKRYLLPNNPRVDNVCITGPSEAYAAASATTSPTSPAGIYRFDGTSWTGVAALPNSSVSVVDLACPAPGQLFVNAGNGQGFYKWNGSTWAALPTAGLGTGRNYRMAVTSASEIYVYGDSASINRAYYRYDGTGTWRSIGQSRFTQAQGRPWADPRGGAAYVAGPFGRIERVSATALTVLSYQPALRDIVVTSATSAFAVGWNLFLARWDGSAWHVDAPPPNTPAIRILQGVWSDGPSNAWAVGNASTILRYNGSGWSIVSDFSHPIATADSYNAVWGVGSDVWAVGGTSILHCTAPTACANESSGGSGVLYAIWGTSRSNVFAVGAGGRIARYNGTSWSAMNSPTSRNLARVAGSGPSDVWAVGDSVLIHFDGTQWTNFPISAGDQNLVSHVPSPYLQALFQVGLWVRGPNEVYLGSENGGISRWDGTRWNEVDRQNFRRRVVGISGAGGCVLAVTEGQTDLPSPTLWRGLGPSGCFSAPFPTPSSWP
ncbi:MAG: hypothetical protein HY084_02760 [Gemmatimonadetes bacterium]|nr:hypothetical protein [Gemmatimonadota bacterium]